MAEPGPQLVLWAPDRVAVQDRLAEAGLANAPGVQVVSELAALPVGSGGAALVALGAAPAGRAAELVLPADFTARELATACALVREIVRLRRALAQESRAAGSWRTLAHRDPLTGLANRRGWEEALQQIAQGVAPASVCLAVLDVDGLKQVNDQQGYAAGDALLQRVAKGLANAIRPHDFAARLGGDEFGLLLMGAPLERASDVVERIRRAAGAAARATFSVGWAAPCVGVVLAPAGTEALWRSAEGALRRAKAEGKDKSCGGAIEP